jgi:hypothetical protein
MTHKDFQEVLDGTFDEIKRLSTTKGKDYANEDRLSHFKDQAELWGITPLQLWGVFAGKHWMAIANYVKRGKLESEPIESRIDDEILYLILLKGLILEERVSGK